ncbi:MAG: alpha/beta hydrolase [Actinomycetales bacterium]|nr:alpha/beta hydrolase [Actinomycetales bacterium]
MSRPAAPRRLLTGLAATVASLALAACSGGTVGTISESTPAPTGSTSSPSSSATATPDARLESFYAQKLVWTGCGGSFQCAKLTVPLDYADPTGATIKLAVLRLRTANQAGRLGSLVLNPGGPGASGVDFARAARAVIDDPVRAKYDIVGFDPRGVGASDPVRCLTDRQLDTFIAADGTPDTPAEVKQSEQLAQGFAMGCRTHSPKIYAHIGTRDAVRDIDILRAALGDQKLNWFGFSYGTMLGASYADEFPTKVGRMVLDGAIDPSLSNVELIHGQAKGFELALHRFVEDCDKQPDCPLPKGVQAGVDRIAQFFAGLDSRPLATSDPKRPLTQALAQNAVASYLYFPSYGDWESLRFGLQAAFDGDGSTLLSMLDERLSRNDSGHYTDNSTSALYAISALDRPDRPDAAQSAALAAQWSKEAPVFGAFTAWGILPYHYWDVPATDTPHEIHAPGSPPILVVGTTYDPATPYPWAQALARQLSQGVLLTRVGDGHTGYGKGNACIDSAVDRFLTSSVTPPAGTVCR